MKTTLKSPSFKTHSLRAARALAGSIVALLSTQSLHAAALTWDLTSGDGATITPGSGNWNTTAGNLVWNNAGANPNVIWSQTNTTTATNSAIFAGADGTVDSYVVTLAAQIATSALTFNNTGYKITGSTVYLASGGAITVAAGKTATINSAITGVNAGSNVTINSGSTLNLGGGFSTIQYVFQGAGTLNITGGTSSPSVTRFNATTMNQTGGTVNVGTGGTWIGYGGGNVNYTISGGTFNVNNTASNIYLAIGRNNGTSTANLTVKTGGTVNIGTTASNYGSLYVCLDNAGNGKLDVQGGTLTVGTGQSVNAINLFNNISGANQTSTMTQEGGTVTANGIIFGGATGSYDSTSKATLQLSGGNLYVGANGIAFGGSIASTTLPYLIQLQGGTLGGSAAWSSSMNMALGTTGGGVTIQAANSGGTAQNITLSGILSNDTAVNGNITKTGTGTLTLSGSNTYTGVTTVSAGTLSTGASGAFANGGAASFIGQATNAAANLLLSGGTLQYANTGSAESTDRLFTLTASSALDASGTNSITYANTGSIANTATAVQTLTLTGTGSGIFNSNLIDSTGSGTPALSVTKSGSGSWTLAGANTYTGATTVNGGTLVLNYATNASVLNSSSPLTLGGGTLQLTGNSSGTTAQTLPGLTLTANTVSGIALNPNGGTSTTLTLVSPTLTGAAAGLNFNLSGGTTNASTNTLGNTVVAWNPSLTGVIIGAAYTVTDLGGTGYATVSGGNVVRLADPGSAGLALTTGSSTTNYFVNSTYSTSSTSTAGSLVQALSGAVAANTVTVDTTNLASGANLALGGNALTLTAGGGMIFAGANPYTITGTGGITSSATGAITFNNYITSPAGVTISAPITDNSATAVTFIQGNTGTFTLLGANTYTGTTTVSAGTLAIGSTGSITGGGGLALTGTLTNNGTAQSTLGALTGNGTLNQNVAGTGNLVFSGTNATYTGTINTSSSAGKVQFSGSSGDNIGQLTGSGEVDFNGGGTFTLSNANASFSGILGMNGTTVQSANFGTATINLSSSASIYTLAAGLSISNTINLNNSTLRTGGGSGKSTTYTGTVYATGTSNSIQGDGSTTGTTVNNLQAATGQSASVTLNSLGFISGSGTAANGGGTLAVVVQNGASNFWSGTGFTFSGGLTITGTNSRVVNNTGSTAAIGTGTVTISNGGSLYLQLTATYANNFNISGGGQSNSGAIYFNNNGISTLSGGSITMSASSTIGASGGTIPINDPIGDGGNGYTLTTTTGGTLVLNGTNTYGGGTVISAGGILQIGNNGNAGQIGIGTISNSGTLKYSLATTANVSNTISGTGAFTQAGSGTTALSGSNNYTGVTTVSAGTLSTGASGVFANGGSVSFIGQSTNAAANLVLSGGTLQYANTGTGESTDRLFTLTASSALDASGTNSITYANTGSIANTATAVQTLTLTGTGSGIFNSNLINSTGTGTPALSVTKSGSGSWTLTGVNTYTGATSANGGTLALNYATNASVLSSSSALSLGGGTLQLIGKSSGTTAQTLASLSATSPGGSIVLTPNGGTSTVLAITSATVTPGGGTVNFNYSAGTTNGSTVGNDYVAWNPALTGGIIGAGYTVTDSGGTNFATVTGGKVLRLTTFTGLPVSSGSATGAYNVNSTFSTSSTSTAGSLVVALSGALSANGVLVDTTGLNSGANLALGGNTLTVTSGGGFNFIGANPYSITATSGGGINASAAAGTLFFNNSVTSVSGVTISAPILDNAVTAVAFGGSGTIIVSGANTYTGATSIAGGTLQAGSTAALGSTSGLSINPLATFNLAGNNITLAALSTATGTITDTSSPGSGGLLTITATLGGGNNTLLTGSVGVQVHNALGSSLLTNTANTYSGGTYIGIGSSQGRWTVPNGVTGSGTPGSLTSGIFGTGTIYVGKTTTDQGIIYLGNANATVNNAITYNSQLGVDTGGAVRLDTTGNIFAGTQTAGLTGIAISAYSGGTLTITGKITGSGTFTGTTSAGSHPYGTGFAVSNAGLIVGSSTGNGTGIATVILNNAGANNDYTGDTYVTTSGVLQTNAVNQLPSGGSTGNVYLSGTLNLQGNSQAMGLLSGSGTLDGVSGTPTLTIGGNNATGLTFNGSIKNTAGTLALIKTGTGTQILAGADTYNGSTTVSAGTLALGSVGGLGNGTSNTSGVTVSTTGAALDLNGTTPTASVALALNGTGVGTTGALTNSGAAATYAGAVTLQTSSSIGGSGDITLSNTVTGGASVTLTKVGNDTLNINGAVSDGTTLKTNGGTTNVNAAIGTGTSVVDANATTNFTTSQTLGALNIGTVPLAGLGAAPSFSGGVAVGSVVTPEPGSISLLLVGVLGLAARRRRA